MLWITLLFLTIAQTCFVSSTTPPHIVFIISDDLGFNDVSFHGSKEVPTPNIDAIALDGVILNNYYVAPACTPSRSSLLTGKYAIRLGLQSKTIMASTPFGLPLEEKILPEYLKALDYATYGIGKWNMGHFKKEYLPMERGFDGYFGYWNAKKDYFNHECIEKYTNYVGYDLHDNYNAAWEYNGTYATEAYTRKAKQVIKNHNSSKPLFLYIAHQAPHGANQQTEILQVPAKYEKHLSFIKDEQRRKNSAMVLALDKSVGEIFSALDKSGLLDNTIFVFGNDNGANVDGLEGTRGSNFPLKGGKGNLWEGGVRTVGFVWSPALRNRSRVYNGLMHITDWLPTLVSAAAGPNTLSTFDDFDGLDQWPSLLHDEPSPREEVLMNIVHELNIEGIRWKNFKLVKGSYAGGLADLWTDQSGQTIANTVPIVPKKLLQRYQKVYQKLLRKSEAANILLKKYGKTLDSSLSCTIPGCDTLPNVTQCGVQPGDIFPPSRNLSCYPMMSPCLFDLDTDICEYHNIADDHPEIVIQLEEAINRYRSVMVRSGFKPSDPEANPELHDGVWNPWM